jgi:predicted metal-dependent hydrolase
MPTTLRSSLLRRISGPSELTVHFGGEAFPVLLRRHAQARRYTLAIRAATRDVVLTYPLRGSLKQASEFAQKHGAWIAARLRKLPEATPFAHNVVIPLRGVDTCIEHRPDARGVVWLEKNENRPNALCVAGREPHVHRRVCDYLKREAKRELDAASRQIAAKLGVSVKRISVRDQVSRWGSCSTSGVLSYSWRLILAPPFVLEYLAAHEVAHLVEMNHSPRFWRVVERVYPDFERAKAWLSMHGSDLHRYGNR